MIRIPTHSGGCRWAGNGEVTGQELGGGFGGVKRFSKGTALWLIGYGPMGGRRHDIILSREQRVVKKEMGEGQRITAR